MANFIINGAQALTEDLSFFRGLIIGCGEASALVIAHIMKGTPISPGQLTNLINSAANANQLSGAGFGQTAQNVQWDLAQFGIQSKVQSFSSNILDTLLQGGTPVEIGISNGSRLTGEPSGLRGHFVTVVGKNAQGYVVADPNTAASKSGGFVTDTLQQLQNANPFAMIVPSGTGPGTSNGISVGNPTLDCLANCPPGDGFCYAQCLGGAATSAVGSDLGQAIGQGIQTGVSGIGNTILKTLGLSSGSDLLWRGALLIVAILLIVIGVVAIVFDFLDKSNVEVAGTRV